MEDAINLPILHHDQHRIPIPHLYLFLHATEKCSFFDKSPSRITATTTGFDRKLSSQPRAKIPPVRLAPRAAPTPVAARDHVLPGLIYRSNF
jgi:hypothetical protein